jgi:hypothetical protein
MRWYSASGRVRYSTPEGRHKLIVEIDPGIAAVARALSPVKLNTPRYASHISVVRHETPPNLSVWGKYEGAIIPFEYCPLVHDDGKYYWLQVLSPVLVGIRVELGLPASSLKSRPPDGTEIFHTTIGNTKGL